MYNKSNRECLSELFTNACTIKQLIYYELQDTRMYDFYIMTVDKLLDLIVQAQKDSSINVTSLFFSYEMLKERVEIDIDMLKEE